MLLLDTPPAGDWGFPKNSFAPRTLQGPVRGIYVAYHFDLDQCFRTYETSRACRTSMFGTWQGGRHSSSPRLRRRGSCGFAGRRAGNPVATGSPEAVMI